MGRAQGASTAALSVSILLNLGALLFSSLILRRGTRKYTYLTGDRPRELPLKVRMIQAAFHNDPSHDEVEGMSAWAEWNAISPPGKGFVFLGKDNFAFGVSMWHQMHCLDHIRLSLVNGDDGSGYTARCFHYLRAGMDLANGDAGVAGGGTVHTCRDWRQVHDWMESRHEEWTSEMSERIEEIQETRGYGGRNMTMRHEN
ncbi:hypothetical protein CC80DRAFT_527155, partial [Byssothecium circinans]